MAFRFRLEKVLKHRKSLEQLAQKDFLEAQAELLEAKEKLNSLYQEVDKAHERRHNLVLAGGNQGEELSQIHNYIKGVEVLIERQKTGVMEKMSKVEKMQLALQHAAIEYKVIEKLESRQHEQYRRDEKKLEEKVLTEMTTARFNLRRKDEQ
jgi:flagellar FliJ protein